MSIPNSYRVNVTLSNGDAHYVGPFIPYADALDFALKLRRAGIPAFTEVELSPDFPGDWQRVPCKGS